MLTDNDITQTVLTGHMDYYEKGEKGMGEHSSRNYAKENDGGEINEKFNIWKNTKRLYPS